MTKKILVTSFWVLAICAAGFGQSAFQDITPGASTRNDVERALGQPLHSRGASAFEYKAPDGIAKLEVEYRAGSAIVERIEVYFLRPISRAALVKKYGLPQRADARKANAEGKPVECFGGSALLSLTYASAEESGGVASLGYYSRDLFEKISGISSGAVEPAKSVARHRESCFVADSEIASATRTDHFTWAQRQSTAVLEEKLARKINLYINCPSLNSEQVSSAFADLSVVIAKGVRNYPCFAGDSGVLNEDWAVHKKWASGKSRADVLDNLQWKMRAALGCLSRSDKSSLFAGSSVAIEKGLL